MIGIGWDSHRLEAGRRLVIGGVELEHPDGLGLAGHSDADVLSHAVMDALLGAAGMGDIGQRFPDSDGSFRDADSIKLLEQVVGDLRARGLAVVHVDTTVVMERPKLGPARERMRAGLAAALGVEPGAVNVKASTGEGIGFVGREEGVAAMAVVMLGTRRAPGG
jgi:2-C-methyl-D-erythritol 2,4-cyclodiphosphate synthase